MIDGYFGEDDDAFLATISKKDIYNNLTLENVERFLRSLGVEVQVHSDFLICPTICHNPIEEAESMKLYYYQENKQFHCYTECGENMTIFELYKKYMALNHYEISDEEAEDYIKRFINNFSLQKEKKKKDNNLLLQKYKTDAGIIECAEYPKESLSVFRHYYHPSWLAEGITKTAMDKFNILFSSFQNKIVIPHFDINGRLIGIRARALNPEDIEKGKYMPIKVGDILYSHQLGFNLYGIYEHKNAIQRFRRAIIYEAEKSALLDDGYYGNNSVAVAVCGSSLNKFQVNLLVKRLGVNDITIALDKEFDEPYSDEGKRYREKIIKMAEKYKHLADFYYIFDEQGLLKKKDSPIDKGEETFEKLYKKRIKVR